MASQLLTWAVPLTISVDNIIFTRTFGGDPNATDGYDLGLDVPAAPPGMTYYAYFEIPQFPNFLDTDIRTWISPYDRTIDWTLKIIRATGITSTMSWDPQNFPAKGIFILEWADSSVDMRAQDSVMFVGDRVFTITVTTGFNISGTTGYYFNNQPIVNVTMTLNGSQALSDTDGMYSIIGISEGNYILLPSKDGELGTSISAFDASMVLRYVVGLVSLTPYQMIAADVSGNGSISAFDASYILRHVVGLITEFPVADDWSFVPSGFAIDENNWNTAPNHLSYSPLNSDQTEQDFKGIIYGDVSGNWSPIRQQLAAVPKSLTGEAIVQLGDMVPLPQHQFMVPVKVNSTGEILSAKLKITYDPQVLCFQDLSLGETMREYCVNYHLNQGELTIALAGAHAITSTSDLVLVKFETIDHKFNPQSTIKLKQVVLNEGLIKANFFDNQLSHNPSMPFTMELLQNYPNPFNPQTHILFQIPKTTRVVLEIYDILGQETCTLINEEMPAGYHEVSWDGRDSNGRKIASGVYIYMLKAGDFMDSKKMLFIQ